MNSNEIIGKNLKQIRSERGLSLGQLGELCGVSKVVLSQIERGEANPTINTIWKIASGLKIHYGELLDYKVDELNVIHSSEVPVQTQEEGYRSLAYYTTSPNRAFDWFEVNMDPGALHTSLGHAPGSSEYLYVICGELELTVLDKSYLLAAGDSIHFDGTQQHTYRNTSDTLLRCITLIYYR